MPGLRENIENRLSPELIIDEEFAGLIPPLTPDEFSGLEQSIITEGCREAIIVWNGVIVDGHNRYRICRAHMIPYRIERRNFASRDEAMLWMLRNQLSRRNLNDFQRVEMVRKCEGAVKAQAKERQRGGQGGILLPEKLPEAIRDDSRDTLGAMAGVSGKTYEHAAAVLDHAPAPVIEATRKKELSINTAYEVTRLPDDKQSEVAERIEQGENPRKVVSDVKEKHKRLQFVIHPTQEIMEQVKLLAQKKDTNINSMFLQLVREALEKDEYKKYLLTGTSQDEENS